jgi:hypothetical protein
MLNLEYFKNYIADYESMDNPGIIDLASVREATAKIADKLAVADNEFLASPEYLAYVEAKEKMLESEAAKKRNAWADLNTHATDLYFKLEGIYKAIQVEKFVETGVKGYPGGSIQVRKKLKVLEPLELVGKLPAKMLSVNESALKKVYKDNEALDLAGLLEHVYYEEVPTPTVSSDLSAWYSGE